MTIHSLCSSHLFLENGESFEGSSPDYQKGTFFGEVVFTTGMTGYVESLTDPSYAGQIIVFTYPLIGNYGIPAHDKWESTKIHVRGVVVSEASRYWSHSSALHSFTEWLKVQGIPLITGVDTRALTKRLRCSGTMLGAITSENVSPSQFHAFCPEVVSQVSVVESQTHGIGPKKIMAIDCGMKENIIRSLLNFPVTIKRVPYDYNYLDEEYDGIFLSNGPGDPTACTKTIEILREALNRDKPVFGICLGIQLLALAAGATTYKLPFGHRSHNQPCVDVATKRCYITSQNHGYAVSENSLPNGWQVTFKNLNDGSVEGIAHDSKPFFAVQFHPEASPGPTDTLWLFEKFYELL